MQLFKDIANLFFPELCNCCENVLTTKEQIICSSCLYKIPKTNYSSVENPIKNIFYGRINIVDAIALLKYSKKGIVQKLIHNLKYFNHQEIGTYLGNMLANEMIRSDRFKDVDVIIPVPLHKKRLKKRGYNQLTTFGNKLEKKLKIIYNDTILKRKNTSNTQSKKMRLDRWKNVNNQFFISDLTVLENKHVLLIDDVITTGATIETCCNELLKIKNIKISIAVMAFTAQT